MRRINLLPPEEQRRRAAVPTTTRAGIAGGLLILGALLVLVMVGLYLFYYVRLNNEEERIAQLDTNIAQQQQLLADLAPFRDLQARLDAKKPIADGIYRTRFAWDLFLRGLAFVIPDSTALDSFTGTATPVNIGAQTGGGGETADIQNLEPAGTITFSGIARAESDRAYQNVSDFVVRMNNLRFLANASLTSAELDRENSPDRITFEVAAELITRIGESGDEVRIGNDESGGDGDEEEDILEPDEASRPEDDRASGPGTAAARR